MRPGEVDIEDIRALLSELNEAGGRVESTDEARPFSRRERGRVGGTNTLADQIRNKPPGLKRSEGSKTPSSGFSTYTTVGIGDTEMGQRNINAPLNIRLAPLSGVAPPPPKLGALQALPSLQGGAVSKGVTNFPTLKDFGVVPPSEREQRSVEEEIPSAPREKRVPIPPAQQQALASRRPAPAAQTIPLDEFREANFLPIMCARYLQPAGLTPSPRWGHTMTAVSGPLLLMFGGMEIATSGSKASASTLMTFNTNEISWEPMLVSRGTVPSPRHSHTACAYEGHCLVVYGGMSTGSDARVLGDIHLFDLHTQEWKCLWSPSSTSRKSEPAPRYGHTMVLYRHHLFIFGGRVKKGSSTSLAGSDVYVFSLSSGRWKKRLRTGGKSSSGAGAAAKPPAQAKPASDKPQPPASRAATQTAEGDAAFPAPRAFHAACMKGSVMYVNGGGGVEGTVFNDTWCIDLSNSSNPQWVVLHNGATADAYARERHDLFACGEALLVVGGCSSNNNVFNERVAGKFNNFAAVLPVTPGKAEAPRNPCWFPVAMGNMSIVASSKRSFAAAFSGGFVYVFGGQSGSETATNSMIRFLAADGYTTSDARATSDGNDEALRNMLLQLREAHTLPFDVYAIPTTLGAVSGHHDRGNMVGFHKAVLQQRAPQLWEQLSACRNEPLRLGMVSPAVPNGSAKAPGGDALDSLLQPNARAAADTKADQAAANASGILVYYTNGNTRVGGLHEQVNMEQLAALATYIYSGALPYTFHSLLEEDDDGTEEGEGPANNNKEDREVRKQALSVLQKLAVAYDMAPLKTLCEAFSSGQRRAVEKAIAQSTAALRSNMLDWLSSGKSATVTVLCADPHTKEQSSHALHASVLMGASPFFADLLRPLYLGHKQQFQVGPVVAKVTCSGNVLMSTSKRSVLVGPVSIPKLAVKPILHFLYSQEIKVPKEVAYMTMLGAHQLDLPLLQGFCEAIVAREEVNYDTCCNFYHLSRKYQAFLLEEMALLTAVSGYSTVRYSSSYKNLNEQDRHNIDDVAKELGSSDWVPPPAPAAEMKPADTYAERWSSSAA